MDQPLELRHLWGMHHERGRGFPQVTWEQVGTNQLPSSSPPAHVEQHPNRPPSRPARPSAPSPACPQGSPGHILPQPWLRGGISCLSRSCLWWPPITRPLLRVVLGHPSTDTALPGAGRSGPGGSTSSAKEGFGSQWAPPRVPCHVKLPVAALAGRRSCSKHFLGGPGPSPPNPWVFLPAPRG